MDEEAAKTQHVVECVSCNRCAPDAGSVATGRLVNHSTSKELDFLRILDRSDWAPPPPEPAPPSVFPADILEAMARVRLGQAPDAPPPPTEDPPEAEEEAAEALSQGEERVGPFDAPESETAAV